MFLNKIRLIYASTGRSGEMWKKRRISIQKKNILLRAKSNQTL